MQRQRQRHQEFICLLDAIEAAVPAGKLIALPPDQGPDKMIADVPLSLHAQRSNLRMQWCDIARRLLRFARNDRYLVAPEPSGS